MRVAGINKEILNLKICRVNETVQFCSFAVLLFGESLWFSMPMEVHLLPSGLRIQTARGNHPGKNAPQKRLISVACQGVIVRAFYRGFKRL